MLSQDLQIVVYAYDKTNQNKVQINSLRFASHDEAAKFFCRLYETHLPWSVDNLMVIAEMDQYGSGVARHISRYDSEGLKLLGVNREEVAMSLGKYKQYPLLTM